MSLTPEGSIRQVTVGSWTSAPPNAVIERLRDVAHHDTVWGSIREVTVLPRAERLRPTGPCATAW